MKKRGFSLVELLIVMSIVVILATMMMGIFNAVGITNKGRDAKRKKDLARIKIAFEEYFNDHQSYPQDVSSWNIKSNCGSNTIFSPYLNPWPCDPNGNPYKILVEVNKFRVLTTLENKSDREIPINWYTREDIQMFGVGKTEVNYGVSSSNIFWYTKYLSPKCDDSGCSSNKTGSCASVSGANCPNGAACCGDNCFYHYKAGTGECDLDCATLCCGPGCDYQ